MMPYRIVLETPGATKPEQYFCRDRRTAESLLKKLLEQAAVGTKYWIYETNEHVLLEGMQAAASPA